MSEYRSFRMLKGKVSFLIDKRATVVLIILIVLAAVIFLWSTGLGDMKISPLTVFAGAFWWWDRYGKACRT